MTDIFSFKNIAVAIIISWIILFILVPNAMIGAISFLVHDATAIVTPVFTLENYTAMASPVYLKIFFKSFFYALGTTLLTLGAGFPFAYLLTRASKSRQKLLLLFVIIPFWTSSLIRTYALIIIFKANGILNMGLMYLGIIDRPLEILYTDTAVFAGLVYTLLPFMILPLYAALEKLDKSLVEAAFDLGASPVQVFMKVIFPLSLPGMVAGSIMVFLPCMGLFYVPDLLGGAKSMLMGNLIKNQFLVAGNWPFGAAASILLTLLMLGLLWGYFSTMKRFNTRLLE